MRPILTTLILATGLPAQRDPAATARELARWHSIPSFTLIASVRQTSWIHETDGPVREDTETVTEVTFRSQLRLSDASRLKPESTSRSWEPSGTRARGTVRHGSLRVGPGLRGHITSIAAPDGLLRDGDGGLNLDLDTGNWTLTLGNQLPRPYATSGTYDIYEARAGGDRVEKGTDQGEHNDVLGLHATGKVPREPGVLTASAELATPIPGKPGRGNLRTTRVVLWPEHVDVECAVELVGYEQWLPRGHVGKPGAPGSTLPVRATLRPKGNARIADLPAVERFTFQLLDTSREPGICMNWPFGADDRNFDLRLAAASSQPGELSAEDQKLDVTVPGRDGQGRPLAEATVEALDFGGRATLHVVCKLRDGREVMGILDGKPPQDLIRLPAMQGADWIAGSWRKQHDCGQLPAGDDSEETPGNRFDGDGYTLYQEYRGFVLNGRHVQGDPRKKDLIVWNLIGAGGRAGIALFGRIASLRTLVRDGDRERAGGPPFESRGDLPRDERLMNGNRRDGPHRVDQHCVFLWDRTLYRGGGVTAMTPEDLDYVGRPRTTWWVAVEGDDSVNWRFGAERGAFYRLSPRDAELAYPRAIAHELLHAVGVQHHGFARGERTEAFFLGPDDPFNGTGKGRFVDEVPPQPSDFAKVAEVPAAWRMGPEATLTLLWEDTQADLAVETLPAFAANLAAAQARTLEVTPKLGKDVAWWRNWSDQDSATFGLNLILQLGYDQGTDSGDDFCVMRYYFASLHAVPGRTKTYYVIRPGDNRAGRSLCTSATGTGHNAAGHRPKPRFGDALAGRGMGNCAAQVCPNDAYPPKKEGT